jgi:hypothetical protein
MEVLMVLEQSDQKTSKFFVPLGRIRGRTCGCKGSLLNVRKGKYKREHGRVQVESADSMLFFFRCF